MGFHHRKLLNQHHYLSSTMSSPTPSPSPLKPLALKPKQWLPYFDNHEHEHVLREAMIGIACMVGMVVFTCTISLILRYYYSRRSHNHINNNTRRRNSPILFDFNGNFGVISDDEGPVIEHPIWFIRTEGLQESVIDSITVFKYRKKEGVIDGTECSVCLGEFEHEESLKLMPKCSHAFHIPCIDTWLRSHKNCPLCRAPVVHDAAAEPDLEVSGQNHIENLNGTEEGTSSALRIGNDDSEGEDSEIDKVNCHALIGSEEVEVEEEIQPMRRSVSMDSSSASMIFCDVVDLNCDLEGSNTHLDDKNNSSNKDMIISKQGSASSTIYRLGSIGRAFQKRPISLRGSFSHNTKFIFSRHCRSQSSTLPL